jgi:hypothetical protein
MTSIIFFLLISQELPGPTWREYNFYDFATESIGFGGAPTSWNGNIEYACWNPASLGGIKGLSFTGSLKYTDEYTDVTYSSVVDYYKTSKFIPGLYGIAFPLNENLSLSFALNIPYYLSYETDWYPYGEPWIVYPDSFPDSLKTEQTLRFYAFNPIINLKLKEKMYIGLNLAILVKKDLAYLYANKADSIIDQIHYSELGIEPNLGIQFQPTNKIKAGAFIKKGFAQGKERWSEEELYSVKESLPLTISIGMKINFLTESALTWAIDYINWAGVKFSVDGVDREIYYIGDVIKLHLGMEYKIKSKYALRIGFCNEPYKRKHWYIERDQLFINGGLGIELGALNINFAASSSRLLNLGGDMDATNFFLSIGYQTNKQSQKHLIPHRF